MKKALSFFLILALSFAGNSLFAQNQEASDPAEPVVKTDRLIFNHMSLGVGWGLLGVNRAGADIALPLTPHINFRAGFNSMAPLLLTAQEALADKAGQSSSDANIDLKNLKATVNLSYHQNGMDIDKVSLDMTTGGLTNAEFLVDLFPWKKASFHFTVGAFYASSPLVHATGAALNAAGEPGIPKSDWANTSIFGLTTNEQGQLIVDVQYGMNSVKPYVGIGFGRPVRLDRRVSFTMDMGVYVVDGIHLYSYNFYDKKTVELNSDWVNQYDDLKERLDGAKQYLDLANQLPVLPFMRFNLFVRLF